MAGTTALAQDSVRTDLLRSRPPYHLSYGAEFTGLKPYAFDSRNESAISAMRPSFMVRVLGNWVVGASAAFFEDSGGQVFHLDSIQHIPASGNVGSWPFGHPAYDQPHGDNVRNYRPKVETYQCFVGYTLPGRWPRSLVHFTGTATMGVQALRLRETHHYRFNQPSRIMAEPDDIRTAEGMAWAWIMGLRSDLHITKFFSWYTELCMVQQVKGLQGMGSRGEWNGETRSVPPTRRDFSKTYFTGGLAIHL